MLLVCFLLVTCAGMQASKHYINGIFSLDMKLPPGNSSGVVHAWYLMTTRSKSNRDPNHSEIDVENLRQRTARRPCSPPTSSATENSTLCRYTKIVPCAGTQQQYLVQVHKNSTLCRYTTAVPCAGTQQQYLVQVHNNSSIQTLLYHMESLYIR